VVECFESETEAEAELERLLNHEGDRQDEKLISLGNKMTETLTDITENAEANDAPDAPIESDLFVVEAEEVPSKSGEDQDLQILEHDSVSEDVAEFVGEAIELEEPAGIVEEITDPLRHGALSQGRIASARSTDFEGVLLVEGIPTGDRRYIERDAMTWRDLPLPLMFTDARTEGHTGSRIAGVLTDIWREDFGELSLIWGRGHLDRGPVGAEALRMLSEGMIRGVSADIDSLKIAEAFVGDDPQDRVIVLTGGRLMGATLLPFPALQEASIWVVHDNEVDPALVASGAESYKPDLSIITEIVVEETE
jgi:hypothetical protein